LLDEFVVLAHELADAAAAVTRSARVPLATLHLASRAPQYFRTPMDVDAKADASPVTVADRAAEAAMRALLALRQPAHSVFGEEGGLSRVSVSDYVWVLDPIDGTKSFVTGKPLFGTLISLVHAHSGAPLLGLIDQPVLRERWLGVRGRETTLNGQAVRSRRCPALHQAFLYSTTPHMFDARTRPAYDALAAAVRVPLFGCDCYAYGLLSMGLCDLVAEADLKPYDYMALVPVVEGAGGVITDWAGRPLRWRLDDSVDRPGEVLAAGDPGAHAAALSIISAHFV